MTTENENTKENTDDEEDSEYWNIPREIDESSDSDEEIAPMVLSSQRSDKRCYGSSKYEDDHQWLYYSQSKAGWMCKICELYPYSGGPGKGAFSTRPCLNTSHPSHAFKQHKRSSNHQRLEEKIRNKDSTVYDQLVMGAEKINLNKKHTNHLYLRKCIHSIYFMISKNIPLSENYGGMINYISNK